MWRRSARGLALAVVIFRLHCVCYSLHLHQTPYEITCRINSQHSSPYSPSLSLGPPSFPGDSPGVCQDEHGGQVAAEVIHESNEFCIRYVCHCPPTGSEEMAACQEVVAAANLTVSCLCCSPTGATCGWSVAESSTNAGSHRPPTRPHARKPHSSDVEANSSTSTYINMTLFVVCGLVFFAILLSLYALFRTKCNQGGENTHANHLGIMYIDYAYRKLQPKICKSQNAVKDKPKEAPGSLGANRPRSMSYTSCASYAGGELASQPIKEEDENEQ